MAFLSTLFQKINEMLIEDKEEGLWSSARFAFLFSIILSNTIMWGAILYFVISTGKFPEVPEGVVWIYGVANGAAGAYKGYQKLQENKYIQPEDQEIYDMKYAEFLITKTEKQE